MISRFIYLTGAPRTGTTYLSSALNIQTEVLLLDEFPLFDLLRGGTLFDELAGVQQTIGKHYGRNFMDELSDVTDIIAGLQSPAAAGLLQGLGFPNATDKVARAERWTRHVEATLIPGIYQSAQARRMVIARTVLDAVARLALEMARSTKSSRTLEWFGLKMPGLVDVADVASLAGAVDQFTMISTFRDPTRTCHSSMKRHADTLAGKDDWHISSVQQALNEWVHNFYYQKFWSHHLGDASYLPVFYEALGKAGPYAEMGRRLGLRIEKPDHFAEVTSYVADLDTSIPEKIRHGISGARLPSSDAWKDLVRDGKPGAALFELEPVLWTDREWIDMSAVDPAVIYLGYGGAEPDGRWITNKTCRLHFWSPAHAGADRLRIDVSALSNMSGQRNRVVFRFNQGRPACITINPDGTFSAEGDAVVEGRSVTFPATLRDWNTLDTECERTFQVGADPRSLAFKVGSVRLVRKTDAGTAPGKDAALGKDAAVVTRRKRAGKL